VSVLAKLEQRMEDKERAEIAAFGDQFVYMPDHGTKSYGGKDDIIDAILEWGPHARARAVGRKHPRVGSSARSIPMRTG
jgi:hypothetical protein